MGHVDGKVTAKGDQLGLGPSFQVLAEGEGPAVPVQQRQRFAIAQARMIRLQQVVAGCLKATLNKCSNRCNV